MSEELIICPACETENNPLRQTCVNCGQSLIIICPRCNTINAITAEHCLACGLQFDALGHIIARHEVRLEDRFTRQAAAASDARMAEKKTDQARSRQLWDQEHQRQTRLADQLQRRKAQERQLIWITTVIVIVVVAIILLSAVAR